MALYRCDCGMEFRAAVRKVASGKKAGCSGCRGRRISERKTRHGRTGTREYFVWQEMHKRCKNPQNKAYKNYGGRGITVCDRWRDFEAFMRDLGPRPDGATLERRDNEAGYEPSNCYWAPRRTQSRNRRNNIRATLSGVTKCVADWADELGIPRQTVYTRIRSGRTPEEALRGVEQV